MKIRNFTLCLAAFMMIGIFSVNTTLSFRPAHRMINLGADGKCSSSDCPSEECYASGDKCKSLDDWVLASDYSCNGDVNFECTRSELQDCYQEQLCTKVAGIACTERPEAILFNSCSRVGHTPCTTTTIKRYNSCTDSPKGE